MKSHLRFLTVALLLAACGGGTADITTVPITTSTTEPTTTFAATTTTAWVEVDVIALPVAGDAMGSGWMEELFLPYGPDEEQLGTAPGGDGGTLDLGPEYGAQAPDGTWWILDAAKSRLARFTADGAFLGAITLPESVLVGGVYFQFQLPRVMADGTLVAFGFRPEGTAVLRATAAGAVDQIVIPGTLFPRVDDGTLAYGFDDSDARLAIDPISGGATPTEWFVTQAGNRFDLTLSGDGLRIVLPDAGIDRVLPIVSAADPTVPAFGSVEVTTTADGIIHVVMLGASEADETTQLGGYFIILPDGGVGAVSPIRNPFSASDPGSPAHLGAAFGAEQPWFMVVDTDGVHIYRRVP